MSVCRLVGMSVCRSVGLSVCGQRVFIALFWPCKSIIVVFVVVSNHVTVVDTFLAAIAAL